jgi:hypothetical protein
MNNTKTRKYKVQQVAAERLFVLPTRALPPSEAGADRAATDESAPVSPGAGDQSAIPPGASEVLRATTAWRQLCGRTGCAIRRDQFTTWLRNGRVPTIRVGDLYFVRVETLDEMIEKALRGEKW